MIVSIKIKASTGLFFDNLRCIIAFLFVLLLLPMDIALAGARDSDCDGVPDQDEIEIYDTDLLDKDTDDDGFSDFLELTRGYSPHASEPKKLEQVDSDRDGLTDRDELRFGCRILDPDTDRDGAWDGLEIAKGINPKLAGSAKLPKTIKINLKLQILEIFLANVRVGSYSVSTGRPSMPTPSGDFIIVNKSPKAWSRTYGLWMPYWMGIGGTRIGIHELPIWPGGFREGQDHLGRPVSHGCIRLGVGEAEKVYGWTEIGSRVIIK